MRSYDPDDKYDQERRVDLEAPEWMLRELQRNPDYTSWGPHEDYMIVKRDGWNSPINAETWTDFEVKNLNDLNEVVNFYFEVNRPSRKCDTCDGTGTHPDAKWIADSWYRHKSPFKASDANERAVATMETQRFGDGTVTGLRDVPDYPSAETLTKYGPEFAAFCERMRWRHHWDDDITEDEAAALVEQGRNFKGCSTAAEWNAAARGPGLGHDAINSWICIRRRCERFGVPLSCVDCGGSGHHYTGPAQLGLVLWLLHPRKGASRGVEIKSVCEADLPEVYAYLREAAHRNAERFSKIPNEESTP